MQPAEKSYEELIAGLVSGHLDVSENSDWNPLLSALGCRYAVSTQDRDILFAPDQPDAKDERLVCDTLIHAMHSHFALKGYPTDGVPVLDGLARNNRWRRCLEDTNSARHLVMLIVAFLGCAQPGETLYFLPVLRSAVLPGVERLLADWLSEKSQGSGHSLAALPLVRKLFGDAWYWCVPGGDDTDLTGASVIELLQLHKPPFVDGILPSHLEQVALVLPEMAEP